MPAGPCRPSSSRPGKSAFAWHNIDAELAQLTYDSVRDTEPVAATRAEAASIRALTFTSAHLTIELEVTPDSLVGQIVPVQAATIEVQARAGAPVPVAADEIGCFLIHPDPARPVPAALPARRRRRRAHRLDHPVGRAGAGAAAWSGGAEGDQRHRRGLLERIAGRVLADAAHRLGQALSSPAGTGAG